MKKVVLLGDSIRLIGYGKPVAKALSAEFEVWQPDQNCRFAKLLLHRARVVIFATTTPVRAENSYNKNDRIAAYNAAVVPRLQALGVRINDLYTPLSADVPRYIRADDRIHLTEEGAALCADRVEHAIRRAAALCEGGKREVAGREAWPGAPI